MHSENNKPPSTTWGFAGTLIWVTLIAIVFVITQFIVFSIYISSTYGTVSQNEFDRLLEALQYNGTLISLCTFATTLVCSPIIIIAIRLKKSLSIKQYLGLHLVNNHAIRYWLLIIITLIVASDLLTTILDKPIVPDYMLTLYASTQPVWLLWIALVIAAPIFEELLFRGFLLRGLASSFIGPIGAIIVSALLWAVMHIQYDLYGLTTIFVIGIVLGVARLKTDSLLLTMGMHATINLIATAETTLLITNQAI